MSATQSSRYDSRAVIEAAESKLRDGGGGISEAQTAYQSALLDWVDDVTMGDVVADGDDAARAAIANEIAELWLGYAGLNRRSNLVSGDVGWFCHIARSLFFSSVGGTRTFFVCASFVLSFHSFFSASSRGRSERSEGLRPNSTPGVRTRSSVDLACHFSGEATSRHRGTSEPRTPPFVCYSFHSFRIRWGERWPYGRMACTSPTIIRRATSFDAVPRLE